MSRTILSIAYPFAPVCENTPGGAEQILLSLDRALSDRGYRSIVVACEGSTPRGTLVCTPASGRTIDEQERIRIYAATYKAVEQVLQKATIDIIHCHGLDFEQYVPSTEAPPSLVTLHLPVAWYTENALRGETAKFFNCVSRQQHETCPGLNNLVPYIENGVAVPEFAPVRERGIFAIALGRICPEKGFHTVLDAARIAGVPLLMGGQVFPYPEHQAYYDREIRPRLDNFRYRHIGPVGSGEKQRLLRAARCLLIASTVPETSSLVAMEALAQGTPVIAFPSGALAGIVEHGKTGFLVENSEQMARAVAYVDDIDPDACYRAAREKFSEDQMIVRYLRLYEDIIGGQTNFGSTPGMENAGTVKESDISGELPDCA